jgi:hypothetical protein
MFFVPLHKKIILIQSVELYGYILPSAIAFTTTNDAGVELLVCSTDKEINKVTG